MEDMMDEIMGLVSQAKSDLAREIGLEDTATQERVKAAKYNLDAAVAAARQGEYREALRLFAKLQRTLEEGGLLESEWAEIYVAQGIYHARLGDMRATRQVWQKANALEPDNEKLKRIAVRLGLVEG
jgi:tetratricopeptide (TPR) repeat protein